MTLVDVCAIKQAHLHSHIQTCLNLQPGPKVIELFSSSAELSMNFQLLINVEIVKISGKFRFKTQNLIIYPAHKY